VKRLRISVRAVADLDEIWDYSADAWGADRANRYVERLEATMKGLAAGETASRQADNVKAGLRSVPTGRHVIYFRESEEAIYVIRVLHQRMEATRRV